MEPSGLLSLQVWAGSTPVLAPLGPGPAILVV